MDFTIKNLQKSIGEISREIGYFIIDNNGEQINMVRKLTGQNYPRFHAYVKQQAQNFIFSLHLDQKQPSYSGPQHAHSGEYFGPVVENEAERIKQSLA
jgi:excinuclease UvrABC nuclease subunit